MNANQMVDKISRIEVSSKYAPDFRRLMRDERQGIMCALQRKDYQLAAERTREAQRVIDMWGARALA